MRAKADEGFRTIKLKLDGTIAPMTTAMGISGLLCFLSHRLLVRGG